MSDAVTGHQRAGLFLVRAWLEPGSDRQLRARVRVSRDIAHGIDVESTVTDADDLVAALRSWIDNLLAPPDR